MPPAVAAVVARLLAKRTDRRYPTAAAAAAALARAAATGRRRRVVWWVAPVVLAAGLIALAASPPAPADRPAVTPVASPPAAPPAEPSEPAGPTGVLWEQWVNVPGSRVADLPTADPPDHREVIPRLEGPTARGVDYGARLRAYLTPPATGRYTFFLAANDAAGLWLSETDDPAYRVRVAHADTRTGPREWGRSPDQRAVGPGRPAGRPAVLRRSATQAGRARRLGGRRLGPPGHPTDAPAELVPAAALTPFPAAAGPDRGLLATYYCHLDFTGRAVRRLDPHLERRWYVTWPPAPGIDPPAFSARWEGLLDPPADGTYTFRAFADDGVRAWVDGAQVLDAWADHNAHPNPVAGRAVRLRAGVRVPIRVEYYNGLGDGQLRVQWRPPARTSYVGVPADRLSPPERGRPTDARAAKSQ